MTTSRYLLDVALEPTLGSRFQPTGFPDIGAAEFKRPNGETCVLVESAQSMANRLEATAWDSATDAPLEIFGKLPWIRVIDAGDGRYLTSSRTEAHRLASAWVRASALRDKSMMTVIGERLGLKQDTPISLHAMARGVFSLDPFCLVHGVFFADGKWPGQPKVARAITGFIEAIGAQRAESGGVKKDHVRHKLDESGGGSAEGYGTVPYHRTEWTAQVITASFSVDRRQIRSYGLGEHATALLESVALWEIRTLLSDGLRLRTACDLELVEPRIVFRDGAELPGTASLEAAIASATAGCISAGLIPTTGPTDVHWAEKGKTDKKTAKGKAGKGKPTDVEQDGANEDEAGD
jgi:CRISPR-associated protein Csb1